MPRFRRKRWVSFVKKVQTVANKQLGLKQLIFNHVYQKASDYNSQDGGSIQLYSADGDTSNDRQSADMGNIFREIFGDSVFNNSYNSTDADLTKVIRFESASLDVTFQNVGANNTIVDVYRFVCRRDVPHLGDSSNNDPWGIFIQSLIKTGIPEDPDSLNNLGDHKLTYDALGVTPFNSSRFCQMFKILQKRSYVIEPDKTVMINFRLPKGKTVASNPLRNLICKRGLTEGFLYIFRGQPLVESDPEPTVYQASTANVVVAQQRRYSFYLPAGSMDQAAYFGTQPPA